MCGIYGRFDSKIRFEIESHGRFDSKIRFEIESHGRFDSNAKKTIRRSLLKLLMEKSYDWSGSEFQAGGSV